MKRSRLLWPALILAVLASLGIAAAASAHSNVGAPVRQSGATSHTITVSGHGQLQLAPDQATITVGVQTRASDASAAVSDNAAKMTAVINAIEGQGVPASHIQTSNISLYHDDQANVFVDDHQVTVTIDNVDRTGSILDAAVNAGANNSWGVSFGLKDQSSARAQALAAAVADARKHANSIATALGVSISGVGSASEATYNVQPVQYGALAAPQAAAPTPVQPGQLTITADIQVVYTFS